MKLSKKQLWTLAAVVTAAGLSVVTASASRAAGPTYTVCIDIPFHPIFDYVMAKSDTYFAGKPYDVKFKVLDATTQVPAFGAGQCNVMTTPPSFIPRVTQQYHLRVAEFFPLARWTIGPRFKTSSTGLARATRCGPTTNWSSSGQACVRRRPGRCSPSAR